jgi:hypothetical protein
MGVNLVILAVRRPLPVYPRTRTWLDAVGMSQTCRTLTGISVVHCLVPGPVPHLIYI